uniref:Uncharacterized protein n=1 Tax=Sphenodon punctatus TaxID=8508 RepID=A0A8D0H578_SPHPU
MPEGWHWSEAAARPPGTPRSCPRRAVSMCESLDLQGVPAVQAALKAAQHQKRRPKSLCSVGNGLGPGALPPPATPARSRSSLLDFLRLRLPRRHQEEEREEPKGLGPTRPTSMTFLPSSTPSPPAEDSGFLRGGSLWGSRRWNLFGGRSGRSEGGRRNFSSLRKSFSFRLRRGHELLRPTRLRTRSEGDASSLHTCPSKRDLLHPELPWATGRQCQDTGQTGGLWKLITARFRRREHGSARKVWATVAAAARARLWAPAAHSFVNSQEWTLSRSVPELKVGIVGNLSSGKSALVHRYLTGTYVQEESPEGGRFKKEIVVDGQSYLLLIRDEGGPPELQVRDPLCALLCLSGKGSWRSCTLPLSPSH